MADRVTQIGKEVWIRSDPNTAMRVTQIGKEVWIRSDPLTAMRVTQIGKEVWLPSTGAQMTVTVLIGQTTGAI